ncbi:hypothetical protein EOM89_10180, partial [Candidatus Falkowbacteria bacterium]|nr:hypothetical protein [Candidatus Falkowbacteria bacterium]
CLSCGKATRCCRNCRLYQRGRPNDCLEPLAEPVADKTRANFCEHFDPALQPTRSNIGIEPPRRAIRRTSFRRPRPCSNRRAARHALVTHQRLVAPARRSLMPTMK